ncbi:MAG: heme-binding domain-containing protein, partial [Acidobacteria bacterium]|nr:heme-binding domain-containing protein [Acidobacteriota bacterium]
MKKAVKIIVLVLAAGFLVIQLFQIDKSNPPINEGETMEAAVSVPPEISSILSRSCNDCHSNNTVYPWYSYIQPVGWFLKNH